MRLTTSIARWTLFLITIPVLRSPAVGAAESTFQLPAGLVAECVAREPLVRYPLFACFDDRGRLYVAEGTGTNLPGPELVPLKLGKISLLEDTDRDGVFDRSSTFADQLVFPQGVLWHEGAVYVASHPAIWRLRDTDGDGRADEREELVGQFGFNGNGCDIHGPFLGPDGWLYWTDGRHGHKCVTKEGKVLEGHAARIFRCRLDGRQLERVAGGGFDNPVELVFTETGEILGTMDQGTGDALLHYVEGGVYPRDDQPCLSEFPKTGPLLSSVADFSAALPVALCGMVRLRSDALGSQYQDTLLTAQFNVHRIQQHELIADGSTFRCRNKDFLTSSNYDLRLTDVLEDADGSLLIVDMGAWFNYGCPTAKIAKPEITGAIYRIRRTTATRPADPWGQDLPWETAAPEQLVTWLSDPRPQVRDRAGRQLVNRGEPAVTVLAQSLPQAPEPLARDITWTLARIGTAEARRHVRAALSHPHASVRLVALHSVGLERDGESLADLARLACEGSPLERRRAAEALGRLQPAPVTAPLLNALRTGIHDRFHEHALIYALITAGEREELVRALQDPQPAVRRAALLALDQTSEYELKREQVIPLLDTDDPELQQSALDVISRHPGWSADMLALTESWLRREELGGDERTALTGALLAHSPEPHIQQLIHERLTAPATPQAQRSLLLSVLARARVNPFPPLWNRTLSQLLAQPGPLQREAVAVIRSRGLAAFDTQLAELAADSKLPHDVRLSALDCLVPRRASLGPGEFELLMSQLPEDIDPLARVVAARTLGAARLSKPQLQSLIGELSQAGPLTLPLLIPAFAAAADEDIGVPLVGALLEAPGAVAIPPDELRKLLQHFPAKVSAAAEPLFARIAEREQAQEAYLADLVLRTLSVEGSPDRGRQVFFSRKVGCSGCHRMEDAGGIVGPELSHIGRIRDPRALLEAVVFPSSTIIPDYRAYTIATQGGTVHTGMIVRQTGEAVYLRTQQLAEIRLDQQEIESLVPSPVSLMPQGLEKTMSPQELADLLEFLYSRK